MRVNIYYASCPHKFVHFIKLQLKNVMNKLNMRVNFFSILYSKVYQLLRDAIHEYRYLKVKLLPSKYVADNIYFSRFGKHINWKEPKDLNEKINWLKFYSDTSKWSELADKYAVRQYVVNKGLSKILVPLFGMWTRVEDIDFECLPQSFVLKTTHGWGDIIVVKDKDKANIKEIKAILKKNLSRPHGYFTAEPHYFHIPRAIIAEELLIQDDFNFLNTLVDYKIWCFNGEPYFIWACYNREHGKVYVETHGLDWTFHPEKSVFNDIYLNGEGRIPKPAKLDEMLAIARILSEGFPQVRVDMYFVKGNIYFGELTFTSDGGYNDFFKKEFLMELGSKILLPKANKL